MRVGTALGHWAEQTARGGWIRGDEVVGGQIRGGVGRYRWCVTGAAPGARPARLLVAQPARPPLLLAARGGSCSVARSDGAGSGGAADSAGAGAAPGGVSARLGGAHRTADVSGLGGARAGPGGEQKAVGSAS
jgi:hypothetical protein